MSGVVLCLLCFVESLQAQGRILLKSGDCIKNATLYKEKERIVVYQVRYSLHDLLKSDIALIETDSTYIRYDERGRAEVKLKCKPCEGCIYAPVVRCGKHFDWKLLPGCEPVR